MSSSLEGRVAVVFGVANKRSIAWSIAQGLHNAGAKLAITYQNERLEQEARDLILSLPGAEGFNVTFLMTPRLRDSSTNSKSAMASCMFLSIAWLSLLPRK